LTHRRAIPDDRPVLSRWFTLAAAATLIAGLSALPASAVPKPRMDRHGEALNSGNPFDMNDLEWAHCRKPGNWGDCVKVKKHKDTSLEATEKYYEENTWLNGRGDAFRHCYWIGRIAVDIGQDKAELFGDMHENGAPWNPPLEKEMDLRNNSSGRWGASHSENYEDVLFLCKSAADSGSLWIIKDGQLVQG
jgi:hypothetical protein